MKKQTLLVSFSGQVHISAHEKKMFENELGQFYWYTSIQIRRIYIVIHLYESYVLQSFHNFHHLFYMLLLKACIRLFVFSIFLPIPTEVKDQSDPIGKETR